MVHHSAKFQIIFRGVPTSYKTFAKALVTLLNVVEMDELDQDAKPKSPLRLVRSAAEKSEAEGDAKAQAEKKPPPPDAEVSSDVDQASAPHRLKLSSVTDKPASTKEADSENAEAAGEAANEAEPPLTEPMLKLPTKPADSDREEAPSAPEKRVVPARTLEEDEEPLPPPSGREQEETLLGTSHLEESGNSEATAPPPIKAPASPKADSESKPPAESKSVEPKPSALPPEKAPANEAQPEAPKSSSGPGSADKEVQTKTKHKTATVITFLVFAVLFLGCGAGLYYVLIYDSNTPAPTAAAPVTGQTSADRDEDSGPVTRARESVNTAAERAEELNATLRQPEASLPAEPSEIPTITASSREPSLSIMNTGVAPISPKPQPEASSPAEASEPSSPLLPSIRQSTQASPDPAMTEAVSAYLQGIFIGSVRSSETSSRAVINGVQYEQGDLVNESLGLRFILARQGILYFRDANEITYSKRF